MSATKEPLVFICKRGSIAQQSKIDLRKAGVVVVEVDHPADCSLMRGTTLVSSDDMLHSALDAMTSQGAATNSGAISSAGRIHEKFVKNLSELITAQRPK